MKNTIAWYSAAQARTAPLPKEMTISFFQPKLCVPPAPTRFNHLSWSIRTDCNNRLFTQGDPGGKVSILGGHSIGHSKQNEMYPIPNGFRDRAISLQISKIVDNGEILRTVANTGIYCSSDKVGTVYLI
jgi:hypothetical protein